MKASKFSVQYTDHGTKQEHCSICKHYVSPVICAVVEGRIKAGGWCKKFEKKDEE